MMTFKEAKAKLKEIADGKYHSIQYELTEHEDGNLASECEIYIDKEGWYKDSTWEEAFFTREKALRIFKPVTQEIIEAQMP